MRKATIIPVLGILFLLVASLVACSNVPTTVEPVAQQVPVQPTSEATIVGDVLTATAQLVPSATSTADTYEDAVAGFALDYPTGWQIVDMVPQIKASAHNYTVSFLSWQPAAAGSESIPEEGTKVDVSVLAGPAPTLQEVVAEWKQQVATDPAQTLLSEMSLTTAGGLQAVRWKVQSSLGRSLAVMTLVNGRPILLSGQGDEASLEWMVNTLRPAAHAPSGEGQAVQTTTPQPDPGHPFVGSLGAPPSRGCVVYQSGRVRDEELPIVHAEPDPEAAIVGQLGRNRWASGLQRQSGWIEIALGGGQSGWVQ